MNIELLTALFAFAFVSTMTPGPNNIMLMASGMNYGLARSIPHMLGIAIGFPAMVLLIGLGLSHLFETVPYSYSVLQVLCTLYLLYLAWKIATATPVDPDQSYADLEAQQDSSKPLTFLEAATFQWVNPKAWTMGLTAISLYTPPDRPLHSIVFVALAFFTAALFSTNTWTLLGQQMRRFLGNPKKVRVFNIICAVLLVGSLYPMLVN